MTNRKWSSMKLYKMPFSFQLILKTCFEMVMIMQSGHSCLGNQNCWQEVLFSYWFWQGVAFKADSPLLLQSDWHHIVGNTRPQEISVVLIPHTACVWNQWALEICFCKLCILEGCQETWQCRKICLLFFHCQVLALRQHSQDWRSFNDTQVVKRQPIIILVT